MISDPCIGLGGRSSSSLPHHLDSCVLPDGQPESDCLLDPSLRRKERIPCPDGPASPSCETMANTSAVAAAGGGVCVVRTVGKKEEWMPASHGYEVWVID